ncbi:MAG: chromate transporter [Treponema sp.]|jgi:chromate transporter|nr:chromate transporter [Treponema sp.]
MKAYLDLFFTFVKMGCMTFGGGYAMIPILERELINKKGLTTMEEVMDYYTIAQITPGVIAVNVSTFIGYKHKGVLGGFIATCGFVLPGVCAISLIALGLRNFAENAMAQRVFAGIRVAVGALILDTVIKLFTGKNGLRDKKAIVIFVLTFALSAVWSANPVLLVIAAGLAGFFIYRPRKAENMPSGAQ